MTKTKILLLGVGNTGKAVARAAATSYKVIGTTRQPTRLFELLDLGIDPIVMPWPSAEVIEPLAYDAFVLASFPPDGSTDQLLAPACATARKVVYISTTGVYGSYRGDVDDETPVAATEESQASRLSAEQTWRAVGAIVLRPPAIYGPDSGMHIRLRRGDFAIPGDGSNFISRIHVEDLAQLVLAAFERGTAGETFVVGDTQPATHKEVVSWLCERMKLPLPPFASLDEVSHHMRASRRVNSSRVLEKLGVTLRYPTYKEGFESLLGE